MSGKPTKKGRIKTMKTFVEIEKINSYGEKGKALIILEDIVGINEKHVESTKLYDEDGNIVSETQGEKQYGVLVANECGSKEVFYVDETEYTRIKDLLTK